MNPTCLAEIHRLLEVVRANAPRLLAKIYAEAGMHMFEGDALDTQLLYVLANCGNWRGQLARETKAQLNAYLKQRKGS